MAKPRPGALVTANRRATARGKSYAPA
jgi:hypothetical protein